MRQPEDFVNDCVKKGCDWMSILATARAVRKGLWYDDVRELLLARGLMPESKEEQEKSREIAKKKLAEHYESLNRKPISRKRDPSGSPSSDSHKPSTPDPSPTNSAS